MKKWEYAIVPIVSESGVPRDDLGNIIVNEMNRMASDGWRLVPYDFPTFSGLMMEREIQPQIPVCGEENPQAYKEPPRSTESG